MLANHLQRIQKLSRTLLSQIIENEIAHVRHVQNRSVWNASLYWQPRITCPAMSPKAEIVANFRHGSIDRDGRDIDRYTVVNDNV